MADDQVTPSGDLDPFFDYLLRCAVSAPGAETSPTAGRMLARLLIAGAMEGRGRLITPYLVPVPEEDAVFEVRTFRPGDLVPTELRGGLRADVALKLAVRNAHGSDEAVEVVSRSRSGLERRILGRGITGDLEFRFPGPDTFAGPPAECAAARRAWNAKLSSWRALVPPATAPDQNRRPDKVTGTDLGNGRLAEPLSAAIREVIGDLVVEVDLSQVEQLIRNALAAELQEMAEPLAERVSGRLLDALTMRDTESITKTVLDAVALVLPRPEALAQSVAAEVTGMLAQLPSPNRPGEPGAGVEGWRYTIGMEQVQLRLDAVHGQLQKSAELLQTMGDRMEVGDRNAAMAERLAVAADQELRQLVGRIDEQLTALAVRTSGTDGPDGPDEVARVTRKLRESVAQFDRAVARLDAMFEPVDGQPPAPLRLARGAGLPPGGRERR